MKIPRTYRGCRVVIVSSGKPRPTKNTILLDPGVVYRAAALWMGSWSIDRQKRRTLYIQKRYLDAIRRTGAFHRLRYTLEHERIESKLAEQSLSRLETNAHRRTIRKMHPPTRSNPNPLALFKRMERRELTELGLKRYLAAFT